MRTKWRRLSLQLSDELVAALDEWRRRQPDIPCRNEAIRRLVTAALATHMRSNGAVLHVEDQ